MANDEGPWKVCEGYEGYFCMRSAQETGDYPTRVSASEQASELNAAERVRDAAPQLAALCDILVKAAHFQYDEDDPDAAICIPSATIFKIAEVLTKARGPQ